MRLYTLLLISMFSSSASALVDTSGYDNHVHLSDGQNARIVRGTSFSTPKSVKQSWQAFTAANGSNWKALWDVETKMPLRIFGQGVEVPGSNGDGAIALTVSREFLTRHRSLLAPGNSSFVEVVNQKFGTLRIVSLQEVVAGFPVEDSHVAFYFKNDRLFVISSTIVPGAGNVNDFSSIGDAPTIAREHIAEETRGAITSSVANDAMILPIVMKGGASSHHLVTPVEVVVESPASRWTTYIENATGKVLAKKQTYHFLETVNYTVPERWPGGGSLDYPAAFANVASSSGAQITDAQGQVTLMGPFPESLTMNSSGNFVEVRSDVSVNASTTIPVTAAGETVTWTTADELENAQMSAFIHTNIAKEYGKTLTPNLNWLGLRMQVETNIDDQCNAFSTGDSIHFFQSSSNCSNTAQLADVVYHEFGHSYHSQLVISGVGDFDSAFSEGISDYISATITEDPAMGRGFRRNNSPLRHINPVNGEAIWPRDVDGDVHVTGLIIAGAMWDLREAMIAEYGQAAGKEKTDLIMVELMQRTTDIPSSYVEALVADDDDGDLSNGTPNQCIIDEAFGRHGLSDASTIGGQFAFPQHNGLEIKMPKIESNPLCPPPALTSATLRYRVKDSGNAFTELAMVDSNDSLSATIPSQGNGVALQYDIALSFDNNTQTTLPVNPASRYYESYVGDTVPLYCSSFETSNPFQDGWSHGLTSGSTGPGADDWQWGIPSGASTDPNAAHDGQFVIGNDLGQDDFNGEYQGDVTNFLLSPVVDTQGYPVVRLQYYRWLSVEDGIFDMANIYANNALIWRNAQSQGELHHQDAEWRFQDLDISNQITETEQVQVKFELVSDGGFEIGGWNIDSFCIVGTGEDGKCAGASCQNEQDFLVGGGGCRSSNPSWPILFMLLILVCSGRRLNKA